MAVTVGVLSDTRRRTLEGVCDTFAPSVDVPDADDTTRAFYARAASDLSVAAQIEALLVGEAVEEQERERAQLANRELGLGRGLADPVQ